MTVAFQNWASSNYECDRTLCTHANNLKNQEKRSRLLSTAFINRSQVSENQLSEAEGMARLVSVADVISQIFKITLEIVLSPIVCVGLIGVTIVSIPIDLCKGTLSDWFNTELFLMAFALPVLSIVSRIYLMGVDLGCSVHLITPSNAADNRQHLFEDLNSILMLMGSMTTCCS